MTVIEERLFALREEKNAAFVAKLVPNIDASSILGVRTPALRKLAKELYREGYAEEFMRQLPHKLFEENGLHAFFIEQIPDYDVCLAELERFLPYVDNWATCDSLSPKVFRKHRAELLGPIRRWIASGEEYTVRFGVGMLMQHYLDEAFDPVFLDWAAQLRSEAYYVRMMVAWYFATALAKQYDAALPYIEQRRLDRWTHNKAIQKALESYRISDEQKKDLKSLKRKKED